MNGWIDGEISEGRRRKAFLLIRRLPLFEQVASPKGSGFRVVFDSGCEVSGRSLKVCV